MTDLYFRLSCRWVVWFEWISPNLHHVVKGTLGCARDMKHKWIGNTLESSVDQGTTRKRFRREDYDCELQRRSQKGRERIDNRGWQAGMEESEAARHPSIEAIRHGPMHTRIAPYTILWMTEAQRARGGWKVINLIGRWKGALPSAPTKWQITALKRALVQDGLWHLGILASQLWSLTMPPACHIWQLNGESRTRRSRKTRPARSFETSIIS